MFKIAIASGKGGTGKTTVSVNLYQNLQNLLDSEVQLVDCDVEEPNDIIFFPDSVVKKEIEVFQLIPVIDKEKCTYCRKCVEYCEFNAIVVIPPIEFAEVNESLCHSCGACLVACSDDAITEKQIVIGKISFHESNSGGAIIEGKLKIGSAMQTMVIKELKRQVPQHGIIIYDAPPGTSCPVVETISDVDYVILVTEPTPFGLHDLKLMIEVLKEIDKPYGVIINKSGLGNDAVYRFLQDNTIELLGEIPFSEEYSACYATGSLFSNVPEPISDAYRKITGILERKILDHKHSLQGQVSEHKMPYSTN